MHQGVDIQPPSNTIPALASKALLKTCKGLASNNSLEQRAQVKHFLSQGANVHHEDDKGNTALHYAAAAGSSEVIIMLLEAGSYIGHQNKKKTSPLKYIPAFCLSQYLDNCLKFEAHEMNNAELGKIHFDYRCLFPRYGTTRADNCANNRIEMQPFVDIARSRLHRHLLKHPILSSFIYLKWKRIWPFLCFSLIAYSFFYGLLTMYVSCRPDTINATEKTMSNRSDANETECWLATWLSNDTVRILTVVLFVIRAIIIIIIIPWLASSSRRLFRLQDGLNFFLVIFEIILLAGPSFGIDAIVVLFVAWDFIHCIGRHPSCSLLFETFKIVTCKLVHLLFFYFMIIIPFVLAIHLVFKGAEHRSLYEFIITTLIFLKEFDADQLRHVDSDALGHIVLPVSVFLITSVMFNVLIALTTMNAESIIEDAKIQGLISKIELLSYVEDCIIGLSVRLSKSSFYKFFPEPLHSLSERILVRREFPQADGISVQPFQSNTVMFRKQASIKMLKSKLSLDQHIITQATNIISAKR